MSSCKNLSTSLKDMLSRKAKIISSKTGDVLRGLRNSIACTELSISIAKTFSTLLITRRHFVAALAPILTWSSWLLELEIESTDAGVQSCLFSHTITAEIYWGIMSHELSPGFFTK